MSKLSQRSIDRLQGVHPDLTRIVVDAARLLPFEILVVEGVRSLERQQELYAQGRTKPGKVVTWTMDSRHRVQKCGFGCAVDLAPIKSDGKVDWDDVKKFLAIGKAMMTAAMRLGLEVRWGYDWDGDGITQERGEYDGPHFELPKSKYP